MRKGRHRDVKVAATAPRGPCAGLGHATQTILKPLKVYSLSLRFSCLLCDYSMKGAGGGRLDGKEKGVDQRGTEDGAPPPSNGGVL